MNDVITAMLRLLLRLVWMVFGLVLLVSFFVAALVAGSVLGLRYLWARLTGRPVMPFIFSSFSQGSRAQWGQFKSTTDSWTSQATGQISPKLKTRVEAEDVTDVESRPARSPGESN
jgi:hypothetical protein